MLFVFASFISAFCLYKMLDLRDGCGVFTELMGEKSLSHGCEKTTAVCYRHYTNASSSAHQLLMRHFRYTSKFIYGLLFRLERFWQDTLCYFLSLWHMKISWKSLDLSFNETQSSSFPQVKHTVTFISIGISQRWHEDANISRVTSVDSLTVRH